MKRLITAMALSLTLWAGAGAETMTIKGTSYTVTRSEKQIASGVKYTELLFPNRTLSGYTGGSRVHVIEADLTDPTVSIEMINNGTLKGNKTLANHAASVSTTDHKVVAGANGNFWITSETPWNTTMKGMPWGVAIRDGVMYTEPNALTAQHCGGPTVTGLLAVDENGRVYIDRLLPQTSTYGEGSGFTFTLTNTRLAHTFNLDMCNRMVRAGTASIYTRQFGTSTKFKPVDLSSDGTSFTTTEGVSMEAILDLAPGESWNIGGSTKFVVKELRDNAGTGTLGDHDLAVVGRDSYRTVMQSFAVGDEVILKTVMNFESGATPNKVVQAISGNVIAMKGGVFNADHVNPATINGNSTYNTTLNERTVYGTNAAGNKLWILVCEHNVAQSKKYIGWSLEAMCDIAKTFGVTEATQVDCGGSAQMYANGSQVSQSYDSSGVRSVYDGLFIISGTGSGSGGGTSTDEPSVPSVDPTSAVNLSLKYSDYNISELSGKITKRAIANGNYVYILAHDEGGKANPVVIVYDHVNKKTVEKLGVTNCVGTSSTLSDIALTEDGYLVGCARDAGTGNTTTSSMLIYKWNKDSNGNPTGEAQQWNVTSQAGNWNNNDTGESMAYYGKTTGGYIYYTSQSNGGTGIRFSRVHVNSAGQLDEAYYNLPADGYGTSTAIGSPLLLPSPFSSQKFIVNGTVVNPGEINFVSSQRGEETVSATTTVLPTGNRHKSVFTFNSHYYMVVPTTTGISMADITNGLASASAVTVNATDLSTSVTSNVVATGTTESGDNELMAVIVVRDGKISKYETPTDSGEDPTPTQNPSLTASTTDVSLTAVHGGTSPVASVKITAANLTSSIRVASNSSVIIAETASDWNEYTGGTINISLNTEKAASTYTGGYVAVEAGSGDNKVRVEINVGATITDGASITVNPSTLSFEAVQGASNPSKSFTVTGTSLDSDITVTSSNDMFTVATASGWNARTGGTVTVTADASVDPGTYSGTVTVKSASVSKTVSLTATITENNGGGGSASTDFEITSLDNEWIYSLNENNLSDASWFSASSPYTRDICAADGKLYVLATGSGAPSSLRIVDAKTHAQVGTLSTEGLSGGTFYLAGIKAMGSTIVGSNMCGAAGTLKVYKWASDTANPEVILETSDHGGVEVGRSMNVSGDMNNGKIFFAYGTTSTNVTVVYYNVTNGVVDSTPVVITIDGVQGGNSSNQSVTYDESDGTFWINNKDNRPTHFNASGTIIDAVSSTTAGKQYGMGISLFTFGGHKYLAYGTTLGSDASSAWGNGAMNLLSLGSTAASAPAQAQADVEKAVATASYTLVGTYPSAGLGDSKTWGGSVGNSSVATDISDDGKTLYLYTMFPAQGVAMYSFEAPVTGVEEVTDDDSSRPVEWYTLQGVRVNGDNLAPGIYITRQGKTVKKVLIK